MRMGAGELALHTRLSVVPFVVRIHHAHKDAHLMIQTCELSARISCIFQSGPGCLEKNPLLRIHCFRLQRRNVEKQRIELIDIIDKAAPSSINGSRFVRTGFLQSPPIPTIASSCSPPPRSGALRNCLRSARFFSSVSECTRCSILVFLRISTARGFRGCSTGRQLLGEISHLQRCPSWHRTRRTTRFALALWLLPDAFHSEYPERAPSAVTKPPVVIAGLASLDASQRGSD